MTDYYIASEQGPLGPYDIDQLKERRIKADDMLWRKGLTEWCRADLIPELQPLLNTMPIPPMFDRLRFERLKTDTPRIESNNQTQQYYNNYNDTCPPTYRWLAIIAFLGIIPCAIVALIKSVMVTRLWEEGKHEAARYQSRKALLWGSIGAIIGIPLSIYMLFFSDNYMISNNILEQLL